MLRRASIWLSGGGTFRDVRDSQRGYARGCLGDPRHARTYRVEGTRDRPRAATPTATELRMASSVGTIEAAGTGAVTTVPRNRCFTRDTMPQSPGAPPIRVWVLDKSPDLMPMRESALTGLPSDRPRRVRRIGETVS